MWAQEKLARYDRGKLRYPGDLTVIGGLRHWSFDFVEVEALQHAGRWDDAMTLMVDAARRLERGGAKFVIPPSACGESGLRTEGESGKVPLFPY